jgi:peptidoglycan/xylan/chitin deacetylase (PgdA/CDA1 family)
MQPIRSTLKPVADRLLRRPVVARTTGRIAAARGRGIVLLWHRVRPDGARSHEVVPAVNLDAFAAQLDVLLELGDVVPLAVHDRSDHNTRPRFALTFDDDDHGHVEHTLPLLQQRGLAATFFLSGRWRGRHGPYWWEVLEQRILEFGPVAVATHYGLPAGAEPVQIGQALTGSSWARELAVAARTAGPAPMEVDQARTLVAAGMEIGFHTVHHPSLPGLDDRELEAAVATGRDELAGELEAPVVRFAYPHGHANRRVASAVRAQGFRSAWTTDKRLVAEGGDPMLHGRWDLGHRSLDAFRAALLRGLARPWR